MCCHSIYTTAYPALTLTPPCLFAHTARAPAVVVDATPSMPAAAGKSGGKRKKDKESSGGLGDALRSAPSHHVDEDTDIEGGGAKTLGERARDVEQGASGHDGGDDDGKVAATDAAIQEALGGGDKGVPPKADSLAVLLTQALMADDRLLVERCLSVGDSNVVENTVARLPPSAVVKLLKAAMGRMRTKPQRGEQLARWMRASLVHHSSYISSSSTAKNAVFELQQAVEQHQALQRPLQSLLGRLDLLLHKQNQNRAKKKGSDHNNDGTSDSDNEGPVNVYDEGDDDLDVMDDGAGGVGTDSEDWETDESGDEDGSEDDGEDSESD